MSVNGAFARVLMWQCGPPPKPASLRPVEFSPWLGWLSASAIAGMAIAPKVTAAAAISLFLIVPPLSGTLQFPLRTRVSPGSRRNALRLEVPVLEDELAGDERRALRILDHRHPGPRGVERSGDDLAAELARLRRRGVGVVDGEGDAPVCRRFGVLVGDGIERGDDVDEAIRRAH